MSYFGRFDQWAFSSATTSCPHSAQCRNKGNFSMVPTLPPKFEATFLTHPITTSICSIERVPVTHASAGKAPLRHS